MTRSRFVSHSDGVVGRLAASGGLHCPVCWESVSALKEQQCGFLVTRCGHWFCEPCLRSAVRVRRECPVCRDKLRTRPPFRPLYL